MALPLLGGDFKSVQPFTRTTTYAGGNPFYKGTSSGLNLNSLLSSITKSQSSAKAANLLRFDQIMDIFDNLIARNQAGGAFEKAGMARIDKAAKRGVGQELSRLVGSGLAGTTEFGAVGRKWEADVSAPARLDLQSIMEDKETALRLGKAGAIERREDVGPDFGLIASLLSRA